MRRASSRCLPSTARTVGFPTTPGPAPGGWAMLPGWTVLPLVAPTLLPGGALPVEPTPLPPPPRGMAAPRCFEARKCCKYASARFQYASLTISFNRVRMLEVTDSYPASPRRFRSAQSLITALTCKCNGGSFCSKYCERRKYSQAIRARIVLESNRTGMATPRFSSDHD